MEFRLLGPLEVVGDDGATVQLGGKRPRALLALLLLHANEAVSTDRLIDGIWSESPPASAQGALQVHVHALRKALGPDRILTRAPGYLVRAVPGELDVDRFEQLVSERAFGDALALWRGPALADVADEPFAQAEAARLEERRLAALEERIDADLDAGRHDAVAAELEALVAAEPHRERLRGQQMLALYRAGRQTDALDAYREARAALDELGLEPSPRLRRLEQQILQHDPVLAPPTPGGRGRETRVAPPVELLGRQLEVAAIGALLDRGDTRLVTLTGPGGTGKTSLALAVARDLCGAEAVFVDLGPVSDPGLVATSIAKALAIDEEPGRPVEETLSEAVAELDRLLVVDNFEHLLEAAGLVGAIVDSGPRMRVLVTSRAPLRLRSEREYQVRPLPVPEPGAASVGEICDVESVRLFVSRAQAVMPGFELRDENASAVAGICRALDGLPLAIELAAARVRVLGPEGMAQRIGQRLALLTRRAPDLPERQRSLRATIEWSIRLLDEDSRAAFAIVGVFASPASLAAIEHVAEHRVADVPGAMEALLDAALVVSDADPSGEPHFRMLETIRDYALEELEASSDNGEARDRHLDLMVATVQRWDASRRDDPNDRGDMGIVDAVYPDVVGALGHASASGALEQEFQLLATIWRYWRWRGYVEDAHHHLEAATGSEDPRVPRLAAADALLGASVIELIRGDLGRAGSHAERAAESYGAVDEPLLQAKALTQLASIANASDDPGRALALCERAVPVLRAAGELDILGIALMATAESARRLRDLDRAREAAVEAVEVRASRGNTRGAGFARVVLADIEGRRGDHAAAAQLLLQSLPVASELGDLESLAPNLFVAAATLAAADDHDPAARLLGAAEAALRRMGAGRLEMEWDDYFAPVLAKLGAAMPGDELRARYDAGLGLSPEDAAGLAVDRLGAVEWSRQDRVGA